MWRYISVSASWNWGRFLQDSSQDSLKPDQDVNCILAKDRHRRLHYTGWAFGENHWCLINHDIYKLVQSRGGMIYYSRIYKDSWEKSQLCDDGQPQMSNSDSWVRKQKVKPMYYTSNILTYRIPLKNSSCILYFQVQ